MSPFNWPTARRLAVERIHDLPLHLDDLAELRRPGRVPPQWSRPGATPPRPAPAARRSWTRSRQPRRDPRVAARPAAGRSSPASSLRSDEVVPAGRHLELVAAVLRVGGFVVAGVRAAAPRRRRRPRAVRHRCPCSRGSAWPRAARRLPSARLYSSEPRSSAWPLIWMRTFGLAARMAALRSSVAWSVERTVAWSYSKLIMAARSAATARGALRRPLGHRARSRGGRARRCHPTGAGVGAAAGAGVGSGAGCSGAGFPPQAAASPAVARTNNREVARIRTPRSGLGSDRGPSSVGGTTQGAAPRQASAAGARGRFRRR